MSFILLLVTTIYFIQKTKDYRMLDPLELEMMTKEEIVQYVYDSQTRGDISYYFLIPVFGFFGVVVGATIYFVLVSDLESRKPKINSEPVLMLLRYDERKVVNKLLEEKGKVHQSEISYLEGFNKIRAHRVVEGLVKKGIVTKEVMGKVRMIKLRKDLLEILRK